MSLASAPFYCGQGAEYGEYAAWADASDALDLAVDDHGWTTHDGQHHCPSCPELGDDRDHHCNGQTDVVGEHL